MAWISDIAARAPEVFLFAAVALGTSLGRFRIRGIPIGATACILVVAVLLGQFGTISIPPILKSILFGFFVFTIGYRSGPGFFASLSFKTLTQVVLALVIGLTGLVAILCFAYLLRLDAGTAAGIGAGSMTQTAMMGTASGALEHIGLSAEALKEQQANLAAGYAVTYICGYIFVLLFVPFVAPRLMGIDLKEEAKKLEAELSGGAPAKPGSLLYRKFQARAYRATIAAGRMVGEIEETIGRRATIERIIRNNESVEPRPHTKLHEGDEILLAAPSAAIVDAEQIVGPEIEGKHVLESAPGGELEVFVTAPALHGLTIREIADRLGDLVRGVFLRSLSRRGQDVPTTPGTRVYVGDVMTLFAPSKDLDRLLPLIGQPIRSSDRTDIMFLAGALAAGLLVGLISVSVGLVPLTLGGGGGALVAGLVAGWYRSRRPTLGAFPPAAQQTLSDFGLGGFVAAIGLASGPAALAAIQNDGLTLLGAGVVITLSPLIVGTLVAYHVLRMNPVVICGALAGAMTVDAAVQGACEAADSQTPVLGVAVPYAIANVVLTMLGPVIVAATLLS
jgi:putative transport protein